MADLGRSGRGRESRKAWAGSREALADDRRVGSEAQVGDGLVVQVEVPGHPRRRERSPRHCEAGMSRADGAGSASERGAAPPWRRGEHRGQDRRDRLWLTLTEYCTCAHLDRHLCLLQSHRTRGDAGFEWPAAARAVAPLAPDISELYRAASCSCLAAISRRAQLAHSVDEQ